IRPGDGEGLRNGHRPMQYTPPHARGITTTNSPRGALARSRSRWAAGAAVTISSNCFVSSRATTISVSPKTSAIASSAATMRCRIRDERHRRARREAAEELRTTRELVVLEVGHGRRVDVEVREQRARAACVFTRDQVDLAQHAQRARRDVLEIADRSGDDEEGAAGAQARRTVTGPRT